MNGAYSELPSWSAALTELAFTKEALAAGRARAVSVWNMTPTDVAVTQDGYTLYLPLLDESASSPGMLEALAYAFALVDECMRVDGLKVPYSAGGLRADPSPEHLSALPAALKVTREFAEWAAAAKNRMVVKHTGL